MKNSKVQMRNSKVQMINSLLHVINSVLQVINSMVQAINSLVKVINYFQTNSRIRTGGGGKGGGNINLQHYQYSISSFISTIIRIYYTFVIILQISITFTIPLKVEHELNSISTFCRSNIHLTHEFQNNLCIPKYEVLSIPINKVKR